MSSNEGILKKISTYLKSACSTKSVPTHILLKRRNRYFLQNFLSLLGNHDEVDQFSRMHEPPFRYAGQPKSPKSQNPRTNK